jgi:hypothetical protein
MGNHCSHFGLGVGKAHREKSTYDEAFISNCSFGIYLTKEYIKYVPLSSYTLLEKWGFILWTVYVPKKNKISWLKYTYKNLPYITLGDSHVFQKSTHA